MEKTLRLMTYVDGGIGDTPFSNSENPIEIGAFRYDAKRMGGAPTITASVSCPTCLDNHWTNKVYALFKYSMLWRYMHLLATTTLRDILLTLLPCN